MIATGIHVIRLAPSLVTVTGMMSGVAVNQGREVCEGPSRLARLVSRIAERDESALAQLYDETNRIVYGLALRLVRDAAAAEDITLEVFLQVWRSAGHYTASRASVTSWLAMLARSRSIDWLRSPQARFAQQSDPLGRSGWFSRLRPGSGACLRGRSAHPGRTEGHRPACTGAAPGYRVGVLFRTQPQRDCRTSRPAAGHGEVEDPGGDVAASGLGSTVHGGRFVMPKQRLSTSELHELAASYALGALDPSETGRFEDHLRDGCTMCEAELLQLQRHHRRTGGFGGEGLRRLNCDAACWRKRAGFRASRPACPRGC